MEAKELVNTRLKEEKEGITKVISLSEARELREAQYLVNSAVHPQSGELIPKIFRLSSLACTNVPIVFGLILLPPTTINIMFF